MDERESAPPSRELTDRFEVGAVLGRGRASVVYAALERSSGARVAVKEIVLDEPEGKGIVEAEIDAHRRCCGPHVVPLLDALVIERDGGDESAICGLLVTELCDGGSLADHLEQAGLLPVDQALEIATQVARGLVTCHDAGVVHADVKPANVLRCDGVWKLGDFGLAQHLTGFFEAVAPEVSGTLGYSAPEVDGGHLLHASDLWSLGVVLFQMLTGRLPFDPAAFETRFDLYPAARESLFPPPQQLRREIPNAVNDLVVRLLSPTPPARGTSGRVASQLECLSHPAKRRARLRLRAMPPASLPGVSSRRPLVAVGPS